MKRILLLSLVLLAGICAFAQDEVPKVEIPVGFSMINVHPNLSPITSFNVFGGGGQFDVNFGRVFGFKADFMGYTQGSGLKSQLTGLGYKGQVSGNMFTYMFGPQIKKHSGKFQPFAEFLFGAAHTNAYANILSAEGKLSSSASDNNAFAMALGGGIDIKASKHVAIRLLEVDYMMTRFGSNVVNYTANQNNFRYVGGLNFMLGGAPPPTPRASCTISPSQVMAGDPVTAKIAAADFNPKHTVDYAWSGKGVAGKAETGNIDTAGLAPGSYTVTATATDPKQKKNNSASCSATFAVMEPPRHPPVASCTASPTTVKVGDPSTLSVNASSPDGVPLTYSYSTTGGSINGSDATATLDTSTANPGSAITATATVTDSRGLTASCTGLVNVLTPPVTVVEASEAGECKFMNEKKPWRVDNECKAVLDNVALRLQAEPNGKIVVLGYTEDQEVVDVQQLGSQRAVNIKYYLTQGEGKQQIDASTVQALYGKKKSKTAKLYFVPAGANFTAEESVTIDETLVKGQSSNAPAPKKAKKAKAATTESGQ